MLRFSYAKSLLPILVTLPSCSLLIDTNPDGIIDTGGSAGRRDVGISNSTSARGGSSATLASAGSGNGGATSATASTRASSSGAGGEASGGQSSVQGRALTAGGALAAGGMIAQSTAATGAVSATSSVATGSDQATGGIAQVVTGGNQGLGSIAVTGGVPVSGGVPTTGGSPTAGGTKATGGVQATGGNSAVCKTSQTRSCSLAGALGTCATGTQACVNENWGACSIQPAAADTCEIGNDDNCNGETNDTTCKAMQISSGNAHTCALLSDGMVRCWGTNSNGELGNGKTAFSAKPVVVSNLRNVKFIDAGQIATCAVTESGSVMCWGGNWNGHLGNATTAEKSTTPVQVNLPTGVQASAVTVGDYHACLLAESDGSVMCWGQSDNGQLGEGGTATGIVRSPVTVSGLTGVKLVHAGSEVTCAACSDGYARCWGSGQFGRNGNSGGEAAPTPHTIGLPGGRYPLGDVVDVGVGPGGLHACALLSFGTVRCWGYATFGQLGSATAAELESSPTVVTVTTAAGSDYTGFVSLSAGGNHTCGVLTDDTGICWGSNSTGQLGNGKTTDEKTPVAVSLLTNIAAIAAGGTHTCALLKDGTAQRWGSNSTGELGDGTTAQRNQPVKVLNLLP